MRFVSFTRSTGRKCFAEMFADSSKDVCYSYFLIIKYDHYELTEILFKVRLHAQFKTAILL